eukprot:6273729-Karenia_brevis.AAC.1
MSMGKSKHSRPARGDDNVSWPCHSTPDAATSSVKLHTCMQVLQNWERKTPKNKAMGKDKVGIEDIPDHF